ncbi:MAG: hypothetical protein KGJ78_18710 [Alphaproteobacteria bacterium]|nr:hypothetical protein [Alphaproteobacteria bacterium]
MILAAVVLGIAGMIPLLPYWLSASSKKPAIARIDGLRTVIVIEANKPMTSDVVRSRQCRPWLICRNGKDGIDVVVLKTGKLPLRPVKATVLTDKDCAADVYGDSHCTNRLRLADGQVIVVKHHHNMQIYPCLTPGETVMVEPQPST